MISATGEAGVRVPLSSPEIPLYSYLIIVARDRPRLFHQLSERYGHAMRVIRDRRRTPRPPLSFLDYDATLACDTGLERNGFMFVPTAVVRRFEGRR